MGFHLQFGQVEEALATLHRVSDAGRAAFRARLRHLKQLDFPPGTRTGKGQRAEYTFSNYLQMVVALELAQAGFAPLRTVYLVLAKWVELEKSIIDALQENESTDPSERLLSKDRAMVLFPEALKSSINPELNDKLENFETIPLNVLADLLQHNTFDAPGNPWRSVMILVKPLAEAAINCLLEVAPQASATSLIADLRDEFEQRKRAVNQAILAFGETYGRDQKA